MKIVTLYKPSAVIAVPALCAIFACAAYAQEVTDKILPDGDVGWQEELSDETSVTGSGPADDDQSVADEGKTLGDAPEIQETADEGIQIQVEKSTSISGNASDSGAIKIYTPWPAKPLATAPDGWQYVPAPTDLEDYKQKVKLSSGNTIDLSITPFVLEPVSDGVKAIRIAEPGYDPALQYAQKNTVGTMLKKSTMELEENEKHAARAISLLQQLLSSLPHNQ